MKFPSSGEASSTSRVNCARICTPTVLLRNGVTKNDKERAQNENVHVHHTFDEKGDWSIMSAARCVLGTET